jgi:hypothetical protein
MYGISPVSELVSSCFYLGPGTERVVSKQTRRHLASYHVSRR